MAAPTADEQLSLELVNRFRMDPDGEFERLIADISTRTATDPDTTSAIRYFGVDLALFRTQMQAYSAVAPLAWSEQLADAAQGHSDLMKARDQQGHQLSGEAGLGGRADAAGYDWMRLGENVYAYADTIVYAHAGFVIDWGYGTGGMQDGAGHRVNIMNAAYTDLGVGVAYDTSSATRVGPVLITQDFGTGFDSDPMFVGVVIDDADGDDFYDVGEGLAGVTVSLSGAAGNYTTTTWASGGWQIEVPSGSYTIKFSGGALGGQVVKTATLSGENVKVDANADDAVASGLRLTGGNSGETLNGGALADVLDGRGGDDRLSGGGDADFLYGGVGADTLDGGANTASAGDAMFGGVGNDTYHVDSGLDLVDEGILFPEYGGGGFDTIISTADFFWDVHSAAERLVVSESVNDAGSDGVTAVGGVFDGTIEGHSGADILFGRGGSDVYRAGDGVDYISLSTLGLTDVNAYAGVDGVNTVVVEQRVTGAASWDIVFEFEAGKDKLDVSDYGYASAADVLARGFDDNAGNSYFALGDGSDYLFLVGVTKAAISEGDFIV